MYAGDQITVSKGESKPIIISNAKTTYFFFNVLIDLITQ